MLFKIATKFRTPSRHINKGVNVLLFFDGSIEGKPVSSLLGSRLGEGVGTALDSPDGECEGTWLSAPYGSFDASLYLPYS